MSQSLVVSSNAALAAPSNSAGFWLRLVAFTIDSIIMPIVTVVAALILLIPLGIAAGIQESLHTHMPDAVFGTYMAVLCIGVAVSELIYFAAFEASPLQATPGKMVLGLIVTDLDGNRLSFGRSLARNFLKLVSQLTLYIGYILAGLTDRKQALHDMMSGCLVVRKQPY